MRYVVIEYKGSHSVRRSDKNLIGYEFSNDLGYLRDKYSLPRITNQLNFQIEKQGFSLYHNGVDLGIIIFDKEVINPDNPYMENIYPLFLNVLRDSKLNQIL